MSRLGKVYIPVFPGTNCEEETRSWVGDNLDVEPEFLDLQGSQRATSRATEDDDVVAVVVPGGFSHGDYLRAGALAARSTEMRLVKAWSTRGVPVLGICNGFQILCESGCLPGALLRNVTRQHHHFPVRLALDAQGAEGANAPAGQSSAWPVWLPPPDDADVPWSRVKERYASFRLPMSCGMGRYVPPPPSASLSSPPLVRPVFRYLDNENGSFEAIAGLTNAAGNVLGLMPHPERASERVLGSTAGLLFLYGLAANRRIAVRPGSELAHFAREFKSTHREAHHG